MKKTKIPVRDMDDTILHYLLHEKKKAGRPEIPDDQKRGKNAVKIYLNESEIDTLRKMVGRGNGASDFVRNLIIQEAKKRKILVH